MPRSDKDSKVVDATSTDFESDSSDCLEDSHSEHCGPTLHTHPCEDETSNEDPRFQHDYKMVNFSAMREYVEQLQADHLVILKRMGADFNALATKNNRLQAQHSRSPNISKKTLTSKTPRLRVAPAAKSDAGEIGGPTALDAK